MKRFKNILLYAGGDVGPEPALERARELALSNQARLTLVDVLPEGRGPWLAQPSRGDLESELIAARCEQLEELATPLREQGVEVKTRVLLGRTFVELIYEVQRRDHDLVMKTAQGSGVALGGLFGSTALHLLRKCPCPVWVVKPDAAERGGIVAAIDPNIEDPRRDRLSRTVLELASSLARARGLELWIVHAWWLWSESMLRSPRLHMSSGQVDEIVAETRDAAENAVRKAVDGIDLTDVAHRVSVVRGLPFEVIREFSKRAEVAVLGTLSRAGISGVLIGNTAERVLHQVDCSVFAVKPPGFETPIQLPRKSLELSA